MPHTALRARALASLSLGAAALACTGRTLEDGTTDTPVATPATTTDTTTSATADATTDGPPPTTAVPDPTTGPGATSTTGPGESTTEPIPPGFVGGYPDAPGGDECDPWMQDCPEGQKCAPVSRDGDSSWERYVCVPVVADPGDVGQPCEDLGTGFDGLDTCAEGHMCWNVDPDTELGVCVAQCVGSPARPGCADPNATCAISGVLNLCLPNCDPLLQDCPSNSLCLPNPYNPETFICILAGDDDEGQVFDPCIYINTCDEGLLCIDPTLAAECDPKGDGCCLPFCDLSAPLACPGAGQQCLPWYQDGEAPPRYQNVGLCGLPQ